MARVGLGPAWSPSFANDFDPVKAATYRANFADADAHLYVGDVWKLDAADLPGRADLAWASSPCQDLSLAGGRAGFAGGRSGAFFGFWRLMEALNAEGRAPSILVIENVVGLLTSNGGQDFIALGQALAAQGYSFGALEIDAALFVPGTVTEVHPQAEGVRRGFPRHAARAPDRGKPVPQPRRAGGPCQAAARPGCSLDLVGPGRPADAQ